MRASQESKICRRKRFLWGSGGGSGGSIHLVVESAELGDGQVTAIGGVKRCGSSGCGGDGGVGRIRIDHTYL
jgi:hypothetical protein